MKANKTDKIRTTALISDMVIHCKRLSENIAIYYFTKSENNCLCVEYDKRWDFGNKSTSGTQFHYIEIHYQNSWVKDKLTEIKREDVPLAIIDLLSYLK